MLYLYIHNVTRPRGVLARGTADYDVAVQVNTVQLARFPVYNHKRDDGYSVLLQRIAEESARAEKCCHARPKIEKRPCAKCQPDTYKEWLFRGRIGYDGQKRV